MTLNRIHYLMLQFKCEVFLLPLHLEKKSNSREKSGIQRKEFVVLIN